MLKPMDDRVVIRPDEAERQTPGGIVLPDQARQKSGKGRVLAIGPGRLLEDGRRMALSVNVGDHVLLDRYAGTEIEMDESDVRIMSEEHVLAVLESAAK